MSARKTPMLALAAVALGLALTACGNSGDGGDGDVNVDAAPTATATSTAQSPTADDRTATGGASSRTPAASKPDQGAGEKCTDQVNYAGDPRPNAEINSIGEETGTCPPVRDK